MGCFLYKKKDNWDIFKRCRKQQGKQNLYEMNGRFLQADKIYFGKGERYRPDIFVFSNEFLFIYAYPYQKKISSQLQTSIVLAKKLPKSIFPKISCNHCSNRGTLISMKLPGQFYTNYQKDTISIEMKKGLENLVRKIANANCFLLDHHLSNFVWDGKKKATKLVNLLCFVKADHLFRVRYREIFKLSDYQEDLYREMITRISEHWYNIRLLGNDFAISFGRPTDELSDDD